jgi:DNA-binding HxlR family transcriptional regulator
MRWEQLAREPCSVARALAVIGDRWTLLVLHEAFRGTRRFGVFLERLGISRPLLKERLDKLVEHGVLRRVPYQDRPPRSEYRLTPRGQDLFPVIAGLLAWGDRWMPDRSGPPVQLLHRPCGRTMAPVTTCPECGDPLDARDVEMSTAETTRPRRRPSA